MGNKIHSSYNMVTLGGGKRNYTRSGSHTLMTLRGGGYGSYKPQRPHKSGFGGGFMSGLQVSGALLATIVVAVLAGVWIGMSAAPPHTRKADTSAGLAYMDTLAQRSPEEVDTILRERHPSILEGWDDISDINGDNVWQVFKEYVILGDSRAVGFYYYGFLSEDRVMAEASTTINKIDELAPRVEALQPRYIFIAYGVNDVGLGLWPTPQDYADDTIRKIEMLKEKIPDAQFVVSSILPVQGSALDKNPAWYNIPDYNNALAETCEANKVIFADNSQIVQEHADLYDADKIHMQRDFYQYWGKNLIEAVYNNENHIV